MRYLAFVLLCLGTVSADEIKPVPDPINDQIHLPTTPVTVQPDDIAPAPSPLDQTLIQDLHEGELYVIDHPMKLRVLDSREGFVKITVKEGPLSLYARFVDGVDRLRYEDRTYAGPFVYVVQAVKSGEVELLIISGEDSPVVRNVLTVTVGPRPPPIPPDPPTPDPDDPPGPPIPGKENRVLIIYESSDLPKYPPAQTAVFAAASLREYLAKKCVKGPDGKTPEYRIWDKDVDTVNVSTVWKDAMKLQRQSLPWIIVSNGSTGFSGPLPTDVDSTVTLLKKYLGD